MKKVTTFTTLTLLLFLLASCGGALKEVTDYHGDITGTVMCDGEPLSSVEVEINPGGETVFTNNNGSYSFKRVEAGNYKLTFSKDGYKSVQKTVSVKAGEVVTADVSLVIEGNIISVDVEVLDFGKQKNELAITLQNKSGKIVSWEVEKTQLPSWLTLSAYEDDIPSKGTNLVSVSVDRSKVEGESAKASINILISSGQTLAVKVTVEAGKVGEVDVYACDVDYNLFIIRFEKGENVEYFYVGADISFERTDDEIIEYGTKYETDTDPIIFFPEYPGELYCLYVLPFNEFGQKGLMQMYEVELLKEPKDKTTPLKDITKEGTYSIKDAVVFASQEKNLILTDDNGHSFFYAYYDYTSPTRPKEDDIIAITNGSVVRKNGILAFENPSCTVTGKIDRKGYYDEAERYWKGKTISSASMMSEYCSSYSSFGVMPCEFKGILTSANGGKDYCLAVGYGDVNDPKGAITSPDPNKLNSFDGSYVSCKGFAVGVSGGTLQFYPYYLNAVSTPLAHYLGTWDASAYNVTAKEQQKWEGMNITTFDSEGENWVYAETWMETGQSYFAAYGRYNPKTGWIDMLGGYYNAKKTFYFTRDPSVQYYSFFYPVSSGEGGSYLIGEGRDSESIAVFKPSLTQSDALILTGDYIPDENGRVANGFVFKYSQNDNSSNYGYFNVYTNLTLTRSTKSTNSSVKPNSIPFTLKKDIQKRYDVKIPYKRTVDSAVSINGDSSKL